MGGAGGGGVHSLFSDLDERNTKETCKNNKGD